MYVNVCRIPLNFDVYYQTQHVVFISTLTSTTTTTEIENFVVFVICFVCYFGLCIYAANDFCYLYCDMMNYFSFSFWH